mmetsp:Transcript_55482/g.129872  ORF Transcript_55482/g.129872 Transcript_55482/m.129872 type:complete len:329 (-) Transcript_55482:5-991(-)
MTISANRDISWADMDKTKYYFYGPSFFFCVRFALHPFTLVKTRLQMQKQPGNAVCEMDKIRYRGTMDAFRKILRHEGIPGLYKGFGISSVGILSGQVYITTYEFLRMEFMELKAVPGLDHLADAKFNFIRNAIAGGCASLFSQTIVVPIDIVSQKRMVYTGLVQGEANIGSIRSMASDIMRKDGIRGFYKGFGASLSVYAPSSAIWWGSYSYFREHLLRFNRHQDQVRGRMLEACAGASAGIVATVVTNPMDVARTRLQVGGKARDGGTLRSTLVEVWTKEGPTALMKGVNARILATVPSSVLIITVYELVKRLSVKNSVKAKANAEQ